MVKKYAESTEWIKKAAHGGKTEIEGFLNSIGVSLLRKNIAPKFNAEGTKKEIIQEILEKLYV